MQVSTSFLIIIVGGIVSPFVVGSAIIATDLIIEYGAAGNYIAVGCRLFLGYCNSSAMQFTKSVHQRYWIILSRVQKFTGLVSRHALTGKPKNKLGSSLR
ncbi:hypothetical protein V1522DRAFT_372360 [Lipomyces starkeyi]